MKVHDFQERLEFSERMSEEGSWVEFYKRLWPDMLGAVAIDKDSKWQRWGVDRIIYLTEGRQVTVDEKKRHKDFDDFLCEEWSDLSKRKVGWTLDKSKRSDFIAYAIIPKNKCYLLPFELLRITCEHNLEKWKPLCKPPYPLDAQNNGWVTRNCAVSWDRLFGDMRIQMHRRWGSEKLELPKPYTVGDQMVFPWVVEQ